MVENHQGTPPLISEVTYHKSIEISIHLQGIQILYFACSQFPYWKLKLAKDKDLLILAREFIPEDL